MLAEYPDPDIDPGLDEQLREFVARRKEEIVRVGA
jgi:trimethylamine:corrinoid methyltransferase-like protein